MAFDLKSSRSAILCGGLAISSLALVGCNATSVNPPARFETSELAVMGDSKTGDLFGWIDTTKGRRFVKFDKTSESTARDEKPQVKVVYKDREAQPSKDVRSGNIFERNDKIVKNGNTYAVNSKIKYREKENKMLYRISITAMPSIGKDGKPAKCISKNQESALLSVYKTPGSSVNMRFEDSDKFWIKDMKIPLNPPAANNNTTSIIDAVKDTCGNTSEVVFHNRADLSLPDFSWVGNGKLMYSGIKIQN